MEFFACQIALKCCCFDPHMTLFFLSFLPNTSGPPIITADAMQHAVKHSEGKLECRVGSSPPPDKIVS